MVGNKCYYRLNGCNNDEFINIVDFKSWLFKSWKYGTERKYFSFIYINRPNEKVIWSYLGFSPILIRYLQGLGYLVGNKELFRSKEIILGNMLYQLYDYQQDAINAWISSGCCGVIKISTGGGKTISACAIIKKMGVKTIICMHTSDLLINAWLNTMTEQFGEEIKSKIGIVGGGLTKGDRKRMGLISDISYEANIRQDIVLSTAQSLLNKLDKLCNERIGLLVWDETHHVSAEQFSKVAGAIRAPYRLGLSASLKRPDGTSPLIWGLMGDIVYKITIKELIGKKVLVSPVFNTIVVNDERIQSDIANCGLTKLDLSRYIKQKSASSIVKKDYVIKLVKSLCANRKKIIMYADFVEDNGNGVYTRDYFVKELNSAGVKSIGVSSDMTGSERAKVFRLLEDNKIECLIFGKLGAEGVNLPRVDSVVMVNATKSTILFPQRTGRAMRTVKGDSTKCNAYIYEILLNNQMELKWSNINFFEYEQEGYTKERVYVK